MSRHNQRWENVVRHSEGLGKLSIETLHVLFPLDVALRKLGTDDNRPPASYFGDWPDHIAWGLDGACAVVRMILAGNALGAAALARLQFERWSNNLIFSFDEVQGSDERWPDFLTRVWAVHHRDCPDAGAVWNRLSEALHGRGPLLALTDWSSFALCAGRLGELQFEAIETLNDALRLTLRQLRYCVAELGVERGFDEKWGEFIAFMPDAFPTYTQFDNVGPGLWPLTLDTLDTAGTRVETSGQPYANDVATLARGDSPVKRHYSVRAVQAWWWRRARASLHAREAFALEARQVGERFSPENLRQTEVHYALVAESSAVVGLWTEGPTRDALGVASEALRAAFWLWLEDDDRAMALARTILEQTARARTWRIKPNKAQRIEDRRSRAAPGEWFEGAGWRRLSLLNQSLSELAHVSPESRWSGARDALVELQTQHQWETAPNPAQTGRGSVLNLAAYLLGEEVLAWVGVVAPALVESFADVLPSGSENPGAPDVEAWFNHAWSIRGMDLGSSDFTRPSRDRNV